MDQAADAFDLLDDADLRAPATEERALGERRLWAAVMADAFERPATNRGWFLDPGTSFEWVCGALGLEPGPLRRRARELIAKGKSVARPIERAPRFRLVKARASVEPVPALSTARRPAAAPLLAFEELEGYAMPREAALAEARDAKERLAHVGLCDRLYGKRWARERRLRDPEGANEARRAWREANRERVRAQERARSARRRRAELLEPIVNVCVECSGEWESTRPGDFCSRICRRLARARERGVRVPTGDRIRALLRRNPRATAREIERALRLNRLSLQTWLQRAVKAGLVAHDRGHPRHYWLALPGNPTGVGEFTLRAARAFGFSGEPT